MKQLGPYTLHERIASGGMGEIYLATLKREAGFEKLLALKRILPHLAHDRSFVGMFEAEARLTALLNHRNIVHIYDFGNVEGEAYIAMEFVDGFDLRALLDLGMESGRLLSLGLALRIAGDCARALDYANRRTGLEGEPLRIIHRDVSPQNVLLSMEGETKLTDFGLAKAVARDPGSMSGMLKGKLGYMAPEQIRGDPLDTRTDIFALGCVLYEMVSYLRVYPADLPLAALVARVTQANFSPLSEVRPGVPREVRAIVERCLAADPGERYESPAAVEQALRDVVMELGLTEPTYTLAEYLRSFAERRRVIATVDEDGTVVSRKPIVQRGDLDATALQRPGHVNLDDTVQPFPGQAYTEGDIRSSEGPTGGSSKRSPTAQLWSRLLGVGLALSLGVAVLMWSPWSTSLDGLTPSFKAPTPLERVVGVRRAESGAESRPRSSIALSAALRFGSLELKGDLKAASCFVRNELRDEETSIACSGLVSLAPGPYRLVVTRPGYESHRGSVVVTAGAATTISVVLKLTLTPCTVLVKSVPSSAAVTLDGERLAMVTPAMLRGLSSGSHTVELSKAGYHTVTHALPCASDTQASYSWVLTRSRMKIHIGGFRTQLAPGATTHTVIRTSSAKVTVRVRATSGGAKLKLGAQPFVAVKVNGVSRGNTPTGFSVVAGRSYTVVLSRGGKHLKTVKVRATETR